VQVRDVSHEPETRDEVIGEADDGEPSPEGLASIILVDRDDDVAAVCGRVDTAPTFAVIISAPRGNRSLSTELGMRRLQRHAEEGGRVVAIATRSRSLAARAHLSGVPVAGRAEHVRWDAGGRKVIRLGWGRSLVIPAFGGAAQLIAIAVVLLVFAALLVTLAPAATISFVPPSETIQKAVTLTASRDRSDVDVARLLVPAKEITGSQTVTLAVPTTGKAFVPVQPAKAALTLTNGSTRDLRVPARAIVVGPGVNFELDQDTLVPAGKTAPATATALQPGKIGNVSSGTLKAWQDATLKEVTVLNEGAASGGTDEERQAVDDRDLVTLRDLAAQLQKSTAVQAKVFADRTKDVVFLNTAKTTVQTGEPSVAVGKPADLVLIDATVTVTALAVTGDTLQSIARGVLTAGRGDGELLPGSVTAVETGARQVNSDDGSVRTEVLMTGQFAASVNRDAIRDAVKGKSVDGARSTLSGRYGIQDSEVHLSPGWAPWLPRFGFRIDVSYRSPAASSADVKAQGQPANATPGSAPQATPRR
jgi:hypothetical protein